MKFGGRFPPLLPDPELIRTLALLLAETGLTEIEYAVGDRRIRIARSPLPAAGSAAAPTIPSPSAAAHLPDYPGPDYPGPDHPGAVTAPMVGTAYLAPQPGDPPYVRLGDTVAAGQPLLVIEAMKVMNEIRAPRPGRIAQILVADAQPIEYGAILMLLE